MRPRGDPEGARRWSGSCALRARYESTCCLGTIWSSRIGLVALEDHLGVLERRLVAGELPSAGWSWTLNGRGSICARSLLKLGYAVGERTVSHYLARIRPEPTKPPSQTSATFLKNHARDIVAIDMFVVPTIRFQVLYVPSSSWAWNADAWSSPT
jgi:hypothetical protein